MYGTSCLWFRPSLTDTTLGFEVDKLIAGTLRLYLAPAAEVAPVPPYAIVTVYLVVKIL